MSRKNHLTPSSLAEAIRTAPARANEAYARLQHTRFLASEANRLNPPSRQVLRAQARANPYWTSGEGAKGMKRRLAAYNQSR